MSGRWVTPTEYHELKSAKEAEARAAYTWGDAANDLALLTHLTLSEATQFLVPLRETDLVPYDAMPHLRHLVDGEQQGTALYALVTGVEWGGRP